MTQIDHRNCFSSPSSKKWSRWDWNSWWQTPYILFRTIVLASKHKSWFLG